MHLANLACFRQIEKDLLDWALTWAWNISRILLMDYWKLSESV